MLPNSGEIGDPCGVPFRSRRARFVRRRPPRPSSSSTAISSHALTRPAAARRSRDADGRQVRVRSSGRSSPTGRRPPPPGGPSSAADAPPDRVMRIVDPADTQLLRGRSARTKIGDNTSIAAVCATRSRRHGMPNGRKGVGCLSGAFATGPQAESRGTFPLPALRTRADFRPPGLQWNHAAAHGLPGPTSGRVREPWPRLARPCAGGGASSGLLTLRRRRPPGSSPSLVHVRHPAVLNSSPG